MKRRLWMMFALFAVLGLLAAACGDDDSDDDVSADDDVSEGETPVDDMNEDDMLEDDMLEDDMPEDDVPADNMPEDEPTDDTPAGDMLEDDVPADDMPEDEPADDTPAELGDITTIELIANPWSGSEINVEVAKQILESELGYSVNITQLEENTQWSAINTGDLHASLEVWPSGHAQNRAEFIDDPDMNVADAGLLGPVGQIGWWVPGYMIDQNPALATWEGLADEGLAGLFATAETSDNRGQILHGDPSWVTWEDQIIENLNLHLEVVYAGSEEALLAAFESAFAREAPVLSYFWTPHAFHDAYDLRRVELPAYSDECYEKSVDFGVDCDYPPDNLFKIVWSGLEQGAPAAWEFLHNFNYTTADQVAMLAQVDREEVPVEEAAAAWISANEDVWRAWLP